MSCTVSLSEFVNELDAPTDSCTVLLNRKTGEFVPVSDDDRAAVEDSDDEDLPAWQQESLPKVREALSSDDWLQLPSKWDLNEYRIMEDFCGTIADLTLRGDLLDTVGGRGTFGRFRNMVHRHNLQERWYNFRDRAIRRFAVDWLNAHGIAYRD
jgi:hypothetical protein